METKFVWTGSKFVENEENAMTYKINKPLGFLVMNKQHIQVVRDAENLWNYIR